MTARDIRRRNRQTGTIIIVGTASDWYENDPALRWATVCDDHDRLIYHTTKRDALSNASAPAEWCDLCASLLATGRALPTCVDCGQAFDPDDDGARCPASDGIAYHRDPAAAR